MNSLTEKLIAEAESQVRLSAGEGNPIAEFGVTKEIAFVRGVRWTLEALAAAQPLDAKRLDALLEEKFPRLEPFEQRAPNMRGDDAAVDARDDERFAIGMFIDYMAAAGLILASPLDEAKLTEVIEDERRGWQRRGSGQSSDLARAVVACIKDGK